MNVKFAFETMPASIVFQPNEHNPGVMHGRLLNPSVCWDTESERPVTWQPWVKLEELGTGGVRITYQGGEGKGGRRYGSAETMLEAQKAVIRWAGRRFRIAADGSRP